MRNPTPDSHSDAAPQDAGAPVRETLKDPGGNLAPTEAGEGRHSPESIPEPSGGSAWETLALWLLLILGLLSSIVVGYLLWTKLAAPVPFS